MNKSKEFRKELADLLRKYDAYIYFSGYGAYAGEAWFDIEIVDSKETTLFKSTDIEEEEYFYPDDIYRKKGELNELPTIKKR